MNLKHFLVISAIQFHLYSLGVLQVLGCFDKYISRYRCGKLLLL